MSGWRPLKSAARRGIEASRALAALARWRLHRPRYPAGGGLRLHLGCGDIDHPGFVNVDGRPAPHVHHVQGLGWLDAFADDSVELVYASHCLEHMPLGSLKQVLGEWRRVLRPGGVLRLSVPDFDLLVDAYLDTGREVRRVQMPLMGEQNYRLNFHHVVFTANFLGELLAQAGFHSVRRWRHGEDDWSNLPDWSGRSMVVAGKAYPVSLNLQATK